MSNKPEIKSIRGNLKPSAIKLTSGSRFHKNIEQCKVYQRIPGPPNPYHPRYSRFSGTKMMELINENKDLEEKKQNILRQLGSATGDEKKLLLGQVTELLNEENANKVLIEQERVRIVTEDNKLFLESQRQTLVEARKKRQIMYNIWKNRLTQQMQNNN